MGQVFKPIKLSHYSRSGGEPWTNKRKSLLDDSDDRDRESLAFRHEVAYAGLVEDIGGVSGVVPQLLTQPLDDVAHRS